MAGRLRKTSGANKTPEPPPALYVAADLESWSTDQPDAWADVVTICGKKFVRLTPTTYKWFRRQLDRAESACDRGKITPDEFSAIVDAFIPVDSFARKYGLLKSVSQTSVSASGQSSRAPPSRTADKVHA